MLTITANKKIYLFAFALLSATLLFPTAVPLMTKAILLFAGGLLSVFFPVVGIFCISVSQVAPDVFVANNITNFQVLSLFLLAGTIRHMCTYNNLKYFEKLGIIIFSAFFLWGILAGLLAHKTGTISYMISCGVVVAYTFTAIRTNSVRALQYYIIFLGLGLICLSFSFYLHSLGIEITSQGRLLELSDIDVVRSGVSRIAFGRGDYNFAGGAICVGLSLIVFSGYIRNPLYTGIIIAICGWPVFSTMSRMAIIMLILIVVLWIIDLNITKKISLSQKSALAIVGIAIIIPTLSSDRFQAFTDSLQGVGNSGFGGRTERSAIVLKSIFDAPFFGPPYSSPEDIVWAHNAFIEFARSTGIPGTLLVCIWFFYPYTRSKLIFNKSAIWPTFSFIILLCMMSMLSCGALKTIYVFFPLLYKHLDLVYKQTKQVQFIIAMQTKEYPHSLHNKK